jgi:hypothetical protein
MSKVVRLIKDQNIKTILTAFKVHQRNTCGACVPNPVIAPFTIEKPNASASFDRRYFLSFLT